MVFRISLALSGVDRGKGELSNSHVRVNLLILNTRVRVKEMLVIPHPATPSALTNLNSPHIMPTRLTGTPSSFSARSPLPGAATPQPTASEPVVTVRDLTKSYGGRMVVDHFDLDVHEGEIVGLIGTNGAGKTTAVECMQGLRHPDGGQMRVLGLDPQRDADRLRPQIGSQLQSSALPDRLRVSEAVALFAGPNAQDPEALLARFGLDGKRRTPFAGLSGGERQRLFLVLALLNRPRLLILDELTQGLDPAARRDVWAAVEQLRDDGVTILLVTHELSEAAVLCNRVVAMRDGRVLDAGTPADLIARHIGEATISFTPAFDGDTARDGALEELCELPGVHNVSSTGGLVTIRGARKAIAHVGAWLIARTEPVPDDLQVETPGLEAALLALLDAPFPTKSGGLS